MIATKIVKLSFLAAALGLAIYFFKLRGVDMAKTRSDIPTVRLTLGDPISQVQSQSSYDFKVKNFQDRHPLAIAEPVIFEYTHPERRFTLPAAQFLWLSVYAQHVVDVKASPHLEYLSLKEAHSLVQALIEIFDKAHWKREPSDTPALDELIEEFNDPATSSEHVVTIRKWRGGGDQIYINLRRHWKAAEALPQLSDEHKDLFTITVYIDNDSVYKKYNDAVNAKQR